MFFPGTWDLPRHRRSTGRNSRASIRWASAPCVSVRISRLERNLEGASAAYSNRFRAGHRA
jgi:hypothetical protein